MRLQKGRYGRMTIVDQIEEDELRKTLVECQANDQVFISCFNSYHQFALSGTDEALDRVEKCLVEKNALISPLLYSPPMHSPLMSEITGEFRQFLNTITYYPFRVPLLSNVTGMPFSDTKQLPDILTQHLTHPVQWVRSMNQLERYGISAVIEMSAMRVVSAFMEGDHPAVKCYCYGVVKDRQELDSLFQSDANYRKDKPNFWGRCLCLMASTENKNSNSKEYKRVTDIYKDIKKRYIASADSQFGTGREQYANGLELTLEALKIKHLESAEIKNIVKMLLDETNCMYLLKDVYRQL